MAWTYGLHDMAYGLHNMAYGLSMDLWPIAWTYGVWTMAYNPDLCVVYSMVYGP